MRVWWDVAPAVQGGPRARRRRGKHSTLLADKQLNIYSGMSCGASGATRHAARLNRSSHVYTTGMMKRLSEPAAITPPIVTTAMATV